MENSFKYWHDQVTITWKNNFPVATQMAIVLIQWMIVSKHGKLHTLGTKIYVLPVALLLRSCFGVGSRVAVRTEMHLTLA